MPIEPLEGLLNGTSVSIEIRSLDLVIVDAMGNQLGSFDLRDNPEVVVTEDQIKIGGLLVDFEQSSAILAVFLVERIRSIQRSFLSAESKSRVEYPSSGTSSLPKLDVQVFFEGTPVTLRLRIGQIIVITALGKTLKKIPANRVTSILRAPGIISLEEIELVVPESLAADIDQLLLWFVEFFAKDSAETGIKESFLTFPVIELLREHRVKAVPTKSPRTFDQQEEHERFGGPKVRRNITGFKESLKDDLSVESGEGRMFIEQQMIDQGWTRGQTAYVRMHAGLIQIKRTSLTKDEIFQVTRGDKMIPVRTVQAVQYKPATALVSGFIEFVVAGDRSISDSVDTGIGGQVVGFSLLGPLFGPVVSQLAARRLARLSHENVVTFGKKQEPSFRSLYDQILGAIGGVGQSPSPGANNATNEKSVSDELMRLSHLRDQGFLSEDEFTAAKSKILGI